MINLIETESRLLLVPLLPMPEPAETIFTGLMIAAALVLAVIAVRMSLKNSDWTPLVFLIAGTMASITTEALADYLSHFSHAQLGAIPFQVSYSRFIPLHVFFIYSVYFGAWYLFAYPRMVAKTIDSSFLWKGYFLTAGMAYFFEAIPIQLGMWKYFDPQPFYFWKGTMPLHYAFLNAFSVIFSVIAMDKLRLIPGKTRKWLVMLILGPIAPVMGHIAAGQPYYLTMNSAMPYWMIHLGGLATIALCLLGIWVIIYLAGYDQDRRFTE